MKYTIRTIQYGMRMIINSYRTFNPVSKSIAVYTTNSLSNFNCIKQETVHVA